MPIDAAVFTAQGPRPSMEDTHVLQVEGERALGAVFDGHLGSAVSELAAARFPSRADQPLEDTLRAIHADTVGLAGGACAVVFRLEDGQLRVANVGDAEAAVVLGSAVQVVTRCHRLTDPAERERVLAAGAYLDSGYVIHPRTLNGLMPTRGLGDHDFEDVGVVCDPDRWQGSLGDGWLIAACDGLWDVMSPEELPQFLTGSAQQAADRLGEEALDVRGSFDNVTIIALRRRP